MGRGGRLWIVGCRVGFIGHFEDGVDEEFADEGFRVETDFPLLGVDIDIDEAGVDFDVEEGCWVFPFGDKRMVGFGQGE